MTTKQLLVDTTVLQPGGSNFLTESAISKTSEFLILEGIVMQGDVRNINGRIYPADVLAEAVKVANEKQKTFGGIVGEADHPETPVVQLQKAAIVTRNLRMEGSNVYGQIVVLNNEYGKTIKELFKAGVKIGVSSRGTGECDPISQVVSDFEFITIDAVVHPSAPEAIPLPVNINTLQTESKTPKGEVLDGKSKSLNVQGTIDFIKSLVTSKSA